MTFEQLKLFCAIVESPTFFDAAESMNTTQSTLSKQIIKLEKELDLALLDRSHRSASLTSAGETFYRHAQKLLAEQQLLMQDLQACQNACRLRVGTLPFLTHYHLHSRIRTFTETHPEVDLVLAEVEENQLLNGLFDKQYDLILARDTLSSHQALDYYPIGEDELVAVLPSGHPLAGQQQVQLKELAFEHFLLMNPYTTIHRKCKALFAEAGIQPDIIRTGRVESILSAVAIGEGVSLLAKSNFEVFSNPGLALLSLNPVVPLSVGAAVPARHKLTHTEKQFINALR